MGETKVDQEVEKATTGRADAASPQSDWRDGFLFVGNQLSLDFVNTRPVLDAGPQELLPDSAALLRWLVACGLIEDEAATQLRMRWSEADWQQEMVELRIFREQYREVLVDLEAGNGVQEEFLKQLNGYLMEYPERFRVIQGETGYRREPAFAPESPAEVLGPLAAAVARILTEQELSRLRKCDNCVLQFVDTSKKGLRRWCSMRMCGNRLKVAAYAQRKRLEKSGSKRG